MSAEVTTPTVERELRLKFKVNGESWFKVGGDGANCDAIERVDGGYEIHRDSEMFRVEGADVQYFRQNPRPGYAQEQRDAANANGLPGYVEKLPDGTHRCKLCGYERRTLQSIRIHHGRLHQGER